MALKHDHAYGLRCMLELSSGRQLVLDRLVQERTYRGALEGRPDAEVNDWHIQSVMKTAQEFCWPGAKPHLIVPERFHPTDLPPRPWPSPPTEYLPGVACIADFHSITPVRDASMDASRLVVVWFQTEFAFPIQESVVTALVSLEWEALAFDYEY